MAKNKRINACWLFLLTLLYTAGMVLAVAPSEARFNNTVVTRTMVDGQDAGVTSNCLVSNRDPAVTVLAGELNLYESTNVSFWLHSSGANATGTLRWGVVDSNGNKDPELSRYVRVSMQSGADVLRQETDLELLEDVPMELTVIITPTETARNTAHGRMKIPVAVTWGDSLWGIFQVILPEVEGKEDPEQATEPEETQPEETVPATEPEETQPVTEPQETQPVTEPQETQPVTEPEETQSATEPEQTQPNTEPEAQSETEPTQAVTVLQTTAPVMEEVPQEEGEKKNTLLTSIASMLGIGEKEDTAETTAATEPEQKAAEPAAETVPETTAEPAGETVPVTTTEPTVETLPETTTEPTLETTPETTGETVPATTAEITPAEPEQPTEPEDVKDPIRLETLGKFDSTGMLPVRLLMTDKVTSLRLGLGESYKEDREDPENTPLDVLPLPRYTRFSLDGGKSYYMLAESSVAEFAVDGLEELPLLLDFRYTGMEDGTGFRLVMDAYEGEDLAANCTRTTICGAPASSVKAAVYDRTLYEALPTSEEASGEKTGKQKDSWVLNQHTVLELTLPNEWQEADLKYNIELLTVDEDGALAYKRIDPDASGLVITHNDDEEEEHNIVLMTGSRLPQAGTYRINMEWTYGDLCYIRKQTTFFINYAADAGYLLGGLEVSKND